MRLIAKQPCGFGGRKFFIGETIPTELVADPKAQEKMGVINIVNDNSVEVPDEKSGVSYTQVQIEQLAEIIQSNTGNACAQIAVMNDVKVLTLIVLTEKRKAVNEAAKNRLNDIDSDRDTDDVEKFIEVVNVENLFEADNADEEEGDN